MTLYKIDAFPILNDYKGRCSLAKLIIPQTLPKQLSLEGICRGILREIGKFLVTNLFLHQCPLRTIYSQNIGSEF